MIYDFLFYRNIFLKRLKKIHENVESYSVKFRERLDISQSHRIL